MKYYVKILTCVLLSMQAISVLTAAVVTRGSRELVIDVNEAADDDFITALAQAQRLDVDSIGISFDWDSIETAPGVYDTSVLDIVEAFYPNLSPAISVTLTIRLVHTTQDARPSDLRSLDLDHATVISRFDALLNAIKAATPSVDYTAVIIGSEIDIYFGDGADASNAIEWAKWSTFFTAAVAAAHIDFGSGVPVSSEITREGIFDYPSSRVLWFDSLIAAGADFMAISYYHHQGAAGNFQIDTTSLATRIDSMCNVLDGAGAKAASNWPIRLTQFGMPSSPLLGSSEAIQAQFIADAFTAWDAHSTRIVQMDFTWMHDLSQAKAESYAALDGGAGNAEFIAFLATLALRHRTGAGVDKAAWKQLVYEARARGWTDAVASDFTIQDISVKVKRDASDVQISIDGVDLPAGTSSIHHRLDISSGSGSAQISGTAADQQTNETIDISLTEVPLGGG